MKHERNKPCHCGSGVKYKKCHWMKDRPVPLSKIPRIEQQEVPDRAVADGAMHYKLRRSSVNAILPMLVIVLAAGTPTRKIP